MRRPSRRDVPLSSAGYLASAAWCEFRCEFLTTRAQLPPCESRHPCPEHRVSTTLCRNSFASQSICNLGVRGWASAAFAAPLRSASNPPPLHDALFVLLLETEMDHLVSPRRREPRSLRTRPSTGCLMTTSPRSGRRRMRLRWARALCGAFWLLGVPVSARGMVQHPDTAPPEVALERTQQRVLQSAVNGVAYKLYVSLPGELLPSAKIVTDGPAALRVAGQHWRSSETSQCP